LPAFLRFHSPLILLLTIQLFSVVHAAPPGGGVVRGTIRDASTNEPIAGVNIRLGGTVRGTVSDLRGEFLVGEIDPGKYSLAFSSVGFQQERVADLSVMAGDTTTLTISMTAAPIQTDPVVVIAGKREQSLQEVPVSISVVEAKTIDEYNFPSVEDVMRYVPGVNVVDAQVSIRGSSGYSRGAGSRVLMLVDGIPLLTADTGELNFETLPIHQVDRVEVAKGAGSALYGSNALGGVINVMMKPIPRDPETRVRLSGGVYAGPSFDEWDWGGGTRFTHSVTLSHGRTIGNTGILLHATQTGDDGYRQNDLRKRLNGYARVQHQFSASDELTATFNILHQFHGSFLNWKDVSNALVPPDIQQGDWIRSDRFYLSARHKHVVSRDLFVSVSGVWYHNLFKDNIDTVNHRSLSDMIRGECQVTWSFHEAHILTFGAEGNLQIVDADLFGNRTGSGLGLYAQDEITFSQALRATLGARFDVSELDSLGSDSEISPKVGLLFEPWTGTRLRASAGRGFRSPTAAEAFTTTTLSVITIIPNPSLRSERSTSYEIAWNQILSPSLMVDAAVFQTDLWDLIEPRFVSGTTGQFTNVTRARIRGIELNCSIGLFSRALLMNVGYTLIDPRDLTENDVLKYRHRHLLYVNATFRSGIVTTGADFRYLSRVEKIDEEFSAVISDADVRVPISVVDVRAGIDLTPAGTPLSFMLNVKNVFQYNYVDFIGNLAAPRSYSLVVEGVL